MSSRKGGKFKQGEDELVYYELELDPVPATPGAVTVWDETSGTPEDVTLAVVTGAATISSGLLITPGIRNLVKDHTYRVECMYMDGRGNHLEPWFTIIGER